MDSLKRLNEALSYIEDNLTGEIDTAEAARRACCSEYHFTRMFSFLAGITLAEYIRRRRLTLAAFDLRSRDVKIIDLALDYGYRSPDAFTRAFLSFHGITPTEARKPEQSLKAYPRMSFQLSIVGGVEMNYRIVERGAFRIVGLMERIPIQFEGENPAITMLRNRMTEELAASLRQLSDTEPAGMISASVNFSEGRMEESGELDYYMGVATTQPCPPRLACLDVPPSVWAVFDIVGSAADAQRLWGRIFSEWFASSDYELAEGPELFSYERVGTSADLRCAIWIPVSHKRP